MFRVLGCQLTLALILALLLLGYLHLFSLEVATPVMLLHVHR